MSILAQSRTASGQGSTVETDGNRQADDLAWMHDFLLDNSDQIREICLRMGAAEDELDQLVLDVHVELVRNATEFRWHTEQRSVRLALLVQECYLRRIESRLGEPPALRNSLSAWLGETHILSCNHLGPLPVEMPHGGATRHGLADPGKRLGSLLPEDEETQNSIDRAMEALPDEQRRIMILRYAHGLSVPQIATLLDVPTAKVSGQMHRAEAELRQVFNILAAA